jgi:hypothetical protein
VSASDAQSLLERLAVPAEDAAAIVASLPDPARHRIRHWLLQRASRRLTAGLDGRHGPLDWWPAWPTLPGEAGRWFYAHLFLVATPVVREWHSERGISDAVSWDTLRDVGRRVELYRRKHPNGSGGLDDPGWLVHHYRGELFQLGRLQFLRGGKGGLDIHIPVGGPLLPAAVDESFAQAVEFFEAFFPADASRRGVCQSWLLDPQLADHLPVDANIVAFQRRFHLVPDWHRRGDNAIREAVFGRSDAPLAEVPQDTTLQRAVVAHLQKGGHWAVRRGWCELDAP